MPDDSVQESKMQRALREKRERDAAAVPVVPVPPPVQDDEYAGFGLDEVPDKIFERSDTQIQEDATVDQIVQALNVKDMYEKFVQKPWKTEGGGGSEHLRITCPFKHHKDNKPSASWNQTLDTWFCHGTCQEGGDALDIAAIWLDGFEKDTYKHGKNFPDLKRAIARELGWVPLMKAPGMPQTYYQQSVPEPEDEQQQVLTAITSAPSYVEPIFPDIDLDEDNSIVYPVFDNWQDIAPKGTFLYEWMTANLNMLVPKEYLLFLGLQAIGAAIGRDTYLDEYPQNVYGNLNICTIGKSGIGKSRANIPFVRMMREVLPFHP